MALGRMEEVCMVKMWLADSWDDVLPGVKTLVSTGLVQHAAAESRSSFECQGLQMPRTWSFLDPMRRRADFNSDDRKKLMEQTGMAWWQSGIDRRWRGGQSASEGDCKAHRCCVVPWPAAALGHGIMHLFAPPCKLTCNRTLGYPFRPDLLFLSTWLLFMIIIIIIIELYIYIYHHIGLYFTLDGTVCYIWLRRRVQLEHAPTVWLALHTMPQPEREREREYCVRAHNERRLVALLGGWQRQAGVRRRGCSAQLIVQTGPDNWQASCLGRLSCNSFGHFSFNF